VGDFGGRHFFYLVEDEHGAPSHLDGVERRIQPIERFSARHSFGLRSIHDCAIRSVASIGVFRMSTPMPAGIARNPKDDLK
jgi:hypothetical protein